MGTIIDAEIDSDIPDPLDLGEVPVEETDAEINPGGMNAH